MTFGVAVAVNAIHGMRGNALGIKFSLRYAGRKSWPQDDTQWAIIAEGRKKNNEEQANEDDN